MKKLGVFAILGIILLLVSAIVFSAIHIVVNVYNTIIKSQQVVQNQVENLDAEYQRRYALIDNLVEIVKETRIFETMLVEIEKDIYIQTAEAKASATKMTVTVPETVRERINQENGISKILTNFLDKIAVMAQHYPEIKDPTLKDRKETFESLDTIRSEIKDIEENILVERKNLNSAVRAYNQNIKLFPANILNKTWGFQPLEGFTVINNEARKDVKIKF